MGVRFGKIWSAAAALAVLAAPVPALAIAHGTLTFDQATGTVAANASIPIYLSFTLDADSDPLVTDAGLFLSGGPSEDDLIASGIDLDRPYSSTLNVSFTCSGSFGNDACSETPTAYTFDFNYNAPSFIGGASYDIQPGETVSGILFGTFNPVGNAPAGTYSFYQASLIVSIYQDNGEGVDETFGSYQIASTCAYDGSTCSFVREVTPVPEPGEWALLALGLGIAGTVAKRRRRA